MSERVLIIGAFGYLGGRITQSLRDSGGRELRLVTRRPPQARPAWAAGLEVVQADLGDKASLERLCQDQDTVIHLAAPNEHAAAADPSRALVETGLATLDLLRAAERCHVARFIYMSTAHVYGAPLIGRIDESTTPRPLHPYAITHRTAEDFVLAAHAGKRIEGLVLRLSNSIGGPADPLIDRWMLVCNDLCRQAVREHSLTLESSGLQQRDFIALGDVCRAVLHFLALPAGTWRDGLFNLGGERTLSIIDLTTMIAQRSAVVLGALPPIKRREPRPGETAPGFDYRIDKLKRTGFAPIGDLEGEIDRTLALCRAAFGAEQDKRS